MTDIDRRPPPALSRVRRVLAFEHGLYRSLFRWLTRRPGVPGAGVEAFGYATTVTPLLWVWIALSAVELPFFHLLIPWQTARIVAFVLGVWGLIWMIGLLASLKIHPHLVSDSALRVRNGTTIDLPIAWDAVATIAFHRLDLPSSRTLQRTQTDAGTDLQVGVSGQVNVHLTLRHPLSVSTPQGSESITGLRFWADDPRALVTRVRHHVTSALADRDQRGG